MVFLSHIFFDFDLFDILRYVTGKLTAISSCWNGQLLDLNFYFICITDIITKQCNKSEIHVQTLYKWDSEGSQMTYLNLYPKPVT